MSRLSVKFAALKKEGRAAFVPFITAGDPDMETSFAIRLSLSSRIALNKKLRNRLLRSARVMVGSWTRSKYAKKPASLLIS